LIRKKAKWVYFITAAAVTWRLGRKIVILLQKYQAYPYDAIAVLSEGIGQVVFGHYAKQYFVVPAGVNLKMFHPVINKQVRREHGINENDILLIYTGVLDPSRNLDIVIQAMDIALRQVENLKIMFVGSGPDRDHLVIMAESMGLGPRFIFTGLVEYINIPRYLSSADFAISYLPEGHRYDAQPPTKVAEYLSIGLPTIVTNTWGHRYFIKDGYNGVITSRDDPETLAKAIVSLARDKGLRNCMQEVARVSVERISYDSIVKDTLIPIYNKVLNNGS